MFNFLCIMFYSGMEITEAADSSEHRPDHRPSISMLHTKNMFRKLTMKNRAAETKPNLSRYDGIRFHIKRRGDGLFWILT